MLYPPVDVILRFDGFGNLDAGAFDERTELFGTVFPPDEDVLGTVEVVACYLRVVCQQLLAVEEGFERAAGQSSLLSLADIDDTTRMGKPVQVFGISELVGRRRGDDKVARQPFGFQHRTECLQEVGTVFRQSAEEAVAGCRVGEWFVGIAEILSGVFHPVLLCFARVEAA